MKTMKKMLAMGCILALGMGISACSEDDPEPVIPPVEKTISVSPPSVTLMVGEAQTLVVTPSPASLTPTYTYVSSHSAIASVSGNVITAVAAGAATITVSANDPAIAAVQVPVTVVDRPVITVSPDVVTLMVTETQQLVVTPTPATLTLTYTYASAHPAIATVSSTGLIEAVAAGSTTVTVTPSDPNIDPVEVPVEVTLLIDATLNKAVWTAEATSVMGDNVPENLLDDDRNTVWHSDPTPGLPQGVTIDMKGNKRINGFYFIHNPSAASTFYLQNSITIQTSMDGEDWGQPVYTNTDLNLKKTRIDLPLAGEVIAHYVKLMVVGANPGANWAQIAEFGAYNDAEPLPAPAIFLNAPADAISHPVVAPLAFSWEADDPEPANYTLKLSKNSDLSGAAEFPVAGLSKELTAEELGTIMGGGASVPVYWTVSAAGATSPAVRTLTLTKNTTLVNNMPPFAGEQLNPDGAGAGEQWWERNRLQRLVGWTHNAAALISVSYRTATDAVDPNGKMVIFAYPPASISHVNNGKVHQTVSLEAGEYDVIFHCEGGGGVTAYGVATTAFELPNLDAVTTSDVLGYNELTANPNSDNVIPITLAAPTNVTIGWVYNTFSDDPNASSEFYMAGIELVKK